MLLPELRYKTSYDLSHAGDCSLLGVSPDLTVYVEEIYTEDCWIAQHAIRQDGRVVESVDEAGGANTQVRPLALPADIIKPHPGWHTMNLNYLGPRHRGMRTPERILDMLKPISIHEKMALVSRLRLNLPASAVLGLAESFVVAEARIARPQIFFVCRRVRIAYALAEPILGPDKQLYDYDTLVLYLAHPYDKADTDDVLLDTALHGLPGATFNRPMDCLIAHDHLFIADGGGRVTTQAADADADSAPPSRVHVWEIVGRPGEAADGWPGEPFSL